MSSTLREYSGWLPVKLTPEARSALLQLAKEAGLWIDVADSYVELEYSGPDTNHFVVSFLQKLAPILGNSDGEICCEEKHDDEADPHFEFYQFRDGILWRQRASLVREPLEIV